MPKTVYDVEFQDGDWIRHETVDSEEKAEHMVAQLKREEARQGSGGPWRIVPREIPAYRWRIDIDHLYEFATIDCPNEAGIEGPRGCDPALVSNPGKFEMFDDDGILYYTGTIWGEYDGLEPLDDFGMPNAGCTSIKLNGEIV